MKTGKHYIQVFIESEDDLPKEDCELLAHKKGHYSPEYLVFELNNDFMIIYWMGNIDWYLLPVESTLSDEEMEKEANNYGKLVKENIGNNYQDYGIEENASLDFLRGACWARDRMLSDNDMAELVKAYEELDNNIIAQKSKMPNFKRNKLERREVELWQKITELRNKLNL